MDQLSITPGHVYQAAASNGLHCITLYPTLTPELWHVSVPGEVYARTYQSRTWSGRLTLGTSVRSASGATGRESRAKGSADRQDLGPSAHQRAYMRIVRSAMLTLGRVNDGDLRSITEPGFRWWRFRDLAGVRFSSGGSRHSNRAARGHLSLGR